MLVSLTVGKVDAGVAADISTGSIVDVKVSRNHDAEVESRRAFDDLQTAILSTFGAQSPARPALRCRNATQTAVVLEWDPIALATAKLRSLSLYRNGAKVGIIPRPMEMTSTKISGLAVDTEYTFALVLRTTAGTYTSEKLSVTTHKMTDLRGITVTPGMLDDGDRETVRATLDKVGARLIDQVRIDTTHFICTEGRGAAYDKARDMNIPIVLPEWLKACEREGRLVGVRSYYLDANPKERQPGRATPERLVPAPTTNVIPPTPERPTFRAGESFDAPATAESEEKASLDTVTDSRPTTAESVVPEPEAEPEAEEAVPGAEPEPVEPELVDGEPGPAEHFEPLAPTESVEEVAEESAEEDAGDAEAATDAGEAEAGPANGDAQAAVPEATAEELEDVKL